jgi:hypothetical protein
MPRSLLQVTCQSSAPLPRSRRPGAATSGMPDNSLQPPPLRFGDATRPWTPAPHRTSSRSSTCGTGQVCPSGGRLAPACAPAGCVGPHRPGVLTGGLAASRRIPGGGERGAVKAPGHLPTCASRSITGGANGVPGLRLSRRASGRFVVSCPPECARMNEPLPEPPGRSSQARGPTGMLRDAARSSRPLGAPALAIRD